MIVLWKPVLAAALVLLPATWTDSDLVDSWAADLRVDSGFNVTRRDDALVLRALAEGPEASGQLVLTEHALPEPVSLITARVEAEVPVGSAVRVDVRGRLDGLRWTEWEAAGTALPYPSARVQVRVTLTASAGTAGPEVRSVALAARSPRANGAGPATAARTYRVFATDAGEVGSLTANGRTIAVDDQFAALPSQRGLSPATSGDYSVRVCAAVTARCAYVPVWDVGPWNTADDYWNPAALRATWKDLPQGTPQAQVAFQRGYNAGKSMFGRKVLNPAGIDLAGGTFSNALKLRDNAWVDVTFLWTGTGPTGALVRKVPVRMVPGGAAVGVAAAKAVVPIECHKTGAIVTGPLGSSDVWDRIGPGNFVPSVYVRTAVPRPVASVCP
ncbi:hypothetical protein OIE66_12370 [Nonomuraea sp. NBC_01738]|uniref:hypothetical protein n=1 Tax=Nonomuraea sp. NBC_01738 TaxID=2976003 RepID=UPI002E0F78D5|nr:hypothetical protein OIE66_12370 [Nonomuraea sp. NBC_01738]